MERLSAVNEEGTVGENSAQSHRRTDSGVVEGYLEFSNLNTYKIKTFFRILNDIFRQVLSE